MSWHNIQAHWKEFQAQVKQRWDKLTDEDVARIKGTAKRSSLVCKSAIAMGLRRPSSKFGVER